MKTGEVSVRKFVQAAFFLLTVGIGLQFWIHVIQAQQSGPITVPRPPGVEGFLPIGALMGWKRFLLTGQWDPVHPAAMVIFGYAVLSSVLLRKAFCSWICPVGAFSEWLWGLGDRLGLRPRTPPKLVDGALQLLKYLLLLFFVWAVSRMDAGQIAGFMESPYYKLSDVKMLFFFTRMTLFTAAVLAVLTLVSLRYKNVWCRYLCPYGALLGLFSWQSPTRITRDENHCTGCGRCEKACPAALPVAAKERITSPECTGCMDCTAACPVTGALELKSAGFEKRPWNHRQLGAVMAVAFITLVYLATIAGHWRGGISEHEFRMRLVTIDAPENTHPSVDFK
ncbi:MAG: 4Fe-4S binding protein [Thermodesulfobacteriota bacterium]